jgi:hypothetical protein
MSKEDHEEESSTVDDFAQEVLKQPHQNDFQNEGSLLDDDITSVLLG